MTRHRFLAGVSAFVLACLLLVSLRSAADQAGCTVSSSDVATCTGDQSGGIKAGSSFSSDIISLDVNSLTTAIGPTFSFTNGSGNPAGIILEYSGTDRSSSQTIQLDYNGSGSSGVLTSAASASGFYVYNSGSDGSDSHAGKDAYWTAVTVTSLSTMSLTGSSAIGIDLGPIL